MTLYPWQIQSWQQLQHYVTQHRIPQALLFSGLPGIGKAHLAQQFAFALLCEQPHLDGQHCGQCRRCLLIAAQTHPDFIVVAPQEDTKTQKTKTVIGIDQIRTLIDKLSLKPQFAQHRVVLIQPADTLNHAAANAFLKYLEEPTERTVLILVTHRLHKLPATIRSRCQKVTLPTPSRALALPWLEAQLATGQHEADIALTLAQDAPLIALQYASEALTAQRRECFHAWLSVARGQSHPVMVAEQWVALPEEMLFFWLTAWVIDVMRYHYQDTPKTVYHLDLKKGLSDLAQRVDVVKLYEFYDFLLKSRTMLETPINKQALWEAILISWARLNQQAR